MPDPILPKPSDDDKAFDLDAIELEPVAPPPAAGFSIEENARPLNTETGNAFVRPRPMVEPPPPEPPQLTFETAFSPPTPARPALLTLAIATLTLACLTAAFFVGRVENADGLLGPEPTWFHRVARFVLVILAAGIHTMTGLAASYFAAKIMRLQLGSVAATIARVGIAVSAFLLIVSLSIPVPVVGPLIKALLAGGAYYGLIYLFFGRRIDRTNILLAMHAAIAGLLYFHTQLYAFVAPVVQK